MVIYELLEKFSDLLELRRGTTETRITHLRHPTSSDPGSLIFLADGEHFEFLSENPPAAAVIPKSLENMVENLPGQFTILSCRNLRLAMALIAKAYFPHPLAKQSYGQVAIHPQSFVDSSAKIGSEVVIGPYAVIGRDVTIGNNVYIGPNTVIEAGSTIGEGTYLHPQVFVAHDTHIGRFCEILPQSSLGSEGFGYATHSSGSHERLTHFGRLILEDFVHVGSCVSIDRGTLKDSVIGSGTKIDNFCHLAHNITVGKNCLITAGFISAGSASLGDNNVMGGRVSVAGHISVCDNVHAAALSAIHNNVKKPGAYGGYPLVELKQFLKMQASFAHLPRIRRNLSRVMKKLGLDDEKS